MLTTTPEEDLRQLDRVIGAWKRLRAKAEAEVRRWDEAIREIEGRREKLAEEIRRRRGDGGGAIGDRGLVSRGLRSRAMASSWPVLVFLDIDGVLNGHEFLAEAKSCQINPECVRRLNRILKATDARIVLSSAWRYMIHGHAMTLRGFQYMLRTHGMLGSLNGCDELIIDVTCRDEDIAGRPDQIRAWLDSRNFRAHDDYRYVILDDLDEVWGDLKIVQTEFATGLTDADADAAIHILLDGRDEAYAEFERWKAGQEQEQETTPC